MASISQSFTPPASLPSATGSVTFTRVDSSFAASAASTGRARVDVTVTWTGRGPDRGSATLTAVLFPPLAGQ